MSNVLTPDFRVSYPNVFRAKKNDLNGKDEYSLMALFPAGADLTVLKKAATDAIVAKWGADQKKWPKNLKSPFRKHEDKAKTDDNGKMAFPAGMEAGGIFLTLKSNQKPGLVNAKNQDIIEESDFYAGCWARAIVRPYAYEQKGNAGVAFALQALQKTKEGDPLGGRVNPQEAFSPIEDAGVSGGSDATSLFG